jgi:DNA mismatch repair protein MutH
MKLDDAKPELDKIINIPFAYIMTKDQLQGITIAKGKSGQLLELALGLNNTSSTLDFEDGELKTNKCDSLGSPKETMYITQVSSIIDELLSFKNFYDTRLYKKIDNLLYVPINKEGKPEEWCFLPYKHINLKDSKHKPLKERLENDYVSICRQLIEHIEKSSDGYIHTSNGDFIQIRSKDSKPYSPIYSKIYKKNVSNKNHAFYFKKDFMRYITQ